MCNVVTLLKIKFKKCFLNIFLPLMISVLFRCLLKGWISFKWLTTALRWVFYSVEYCEDSFLAIAFGLNSVGLIFAQIGVFITCLHTHSHTHTHTHTRARAHASTHAHQHTNTYTHTHTRVDMRRQMWLCSVLFVGMLAALLWIK